MEESTDIRAQMYQSFKEGLKTGEVPYFSEADLVEIFDYATDYDDQYVRLEVLMAGARYYPDSEALRMRRGYLYSTFDENAAKEYLRDYLIGKEGVLCDVLRLVNRTETESRVLSAKDACEALSKILDSYDTLTDEEVIQLTDATMPLNCVNWLQDNLDKLREHVTYMPTLLYEVAHIYEQFQLHTEALPLYEELTEIMPFEADFWYCKAQCCMQLKLEEEYATAIDYALALAPENPLYQLAKARAEFLSNAEADGEARLMKLIDNDEVRQEALEMLVVYWEHTEQKKKIASTLFEEVKRNNANKWALTKLMKVAPMDAAPYVERWAAYDKNFSEETWQAWAKEQYEKEDDPVGAILILSEYARMQPLSNGGVDLAQYLLMQGECKAAYNVLEKLYVDEVLIDPENILRMGLLFSVAMAKCNKIKDLEHFLMMTVNTLMVLPDTVPVSEHLSHVGAMTIISNMLSILNTRKHGSRKNPFKDYTVPQLLMYQQAIQQRINDNADI